MERDFTALKRNDLGVDAKTFTIENNKCIYSNDYGAIAQMALKGQRNLKLILFRCYHRFHIN